MRIVASVQAKRGSSRGLVHYIAHSKLDLDRESDSGRELFNSYADNLSVASSNNSIKIGVSNTRPSNDELHHLVLSFRPEDYRKLGRDEKARRGSLKEVTRAAMSRLEKALEADRLSWAAAIHLNTQNPHVHIALQKQYFTRTIERTVLAKIPREALPHHETQEGEKLLVSGYLIDAAIEKMEQLISRDRARPQTSDRQEASQRPAGEVERNSTHERDILREGFLAEYELHRIDSKIKELTEKGYRMRFLVSDPESGRRRHLSLRDIGQRKIDSGSDPKSPAETQIRTILFKMLSKAETSRAAHQSETAAVIREANRVKGRYRRNDWKLPPPSFTKDEVDTLQNHYIQASDLRTFFYLEAVRSELERSGQIGPRNKADLGRIAAMKSISDLRATACKKNCLDFNDRSYYRVVEFTDRRVSLSQLDREQNPARNPLLSFVEKLKHAASRLSGKTGQSTIGNQNDKLRNEIVGRLNEQLEEIKNERKAEQKKSKILEKILDEKPTAEPTFSAEQLAEIDSLTLQLKLTSDYEKNWAEQRTLIRSAGSCCNAYRKLQKANPSADFQEYKTSVIAGRALAKEIVARAELAKAKEDLKVFAESKRFQKFAVENTKTGAIEFASLHDADLPKRRSVLDRAVAELFESGEHHRLRRIVSSLVNDRESRLKENVAAAKDVAELASRHAFEFKEVSLLGLRIEARHRPVFTASEITTIEMRIEGTHDPKEASRLRDLLGSTDNRPANTLTRILRDFENSEGDRTKEREAGPVETRHVGNIRGLDGNEREPSAAAPPKRQDVVDKQASPDLLR